MLIVLHSIHTVLMCEQKVRYVLMDNPDSYRVEGGEGGEEILQGSSTESAAASIGGAATRASIEIWLCRAGLPWPNDGDRRSLCWWASS